MSRTRRADFVMLALTFVGILALSLASGVLDALSGADDVDEDDE